MRTINLTITKKRPNGRFSFVAIGLFQVVPQYDMPFKTNHELFHAQGLGICAVIDAGDQLVEILQVDPKEVLKDPDRMDDIALASVYTLANMEQ